MNYFRRPRVFDLHGSLLSQTISGHFQCDDNTIFLPIGRNRTSQLGRHSPLNELAAKSPSPRGSYNSRTAPLCPNDNDFAFLKSARYIKRAGCGRKRAVHAVESQQAVSHA